MIGALVAGITGSGGASLSSYESIATGTGTGSSGTITFSPIPSGFKHLQIRGIARDSNAVSGTNDFQIRFNSDSGANYAWHRLRGNGTAASAYGQGTSNEIYVQYPVVMNSSTANIVGASILDILDYASTSKYKTLRTFNGADLNGSGDVCVTSGLWMSTSAITSISILSTVNFTTQTTFALYGIKEF